MELKLGERARNEVGGLEPAEELKENGQRLKPSGKLEALPGFGSVGDL